MAVPIDHALVLCAFVVLTASFVGWILALLPPSALVPVFCLLLVAGVVVPPVAARMGDLRFLSPVPPTRCAASCR